MKVPSPTQGRVRAVLPQISFTQASGSAGAGAQAIARGMNSLGVEIEARIQKTDRFNTLRSFSQFETDVAERLTELKRGYNPDGKGFTDAADKLYTEMEQEWLPTVPSDLQEEFKYQTQVRRQGILGDALKFQYESGDAWFRQGISDELSKSKIVLDQTPGALEAEQKRIFDIIEASDLSTQEKAELQRQATIGLASTTYKAAVRLDPSLAGSIGVGEMDAKTLLRQEEGFRPEPYYDKTAWRIGFGSDTITLPDGTQQKVVPGMRITREDAERDLTYRLQEREGKRARTQLGERWDELPANVQAGLASVAYNYGSLPSSVVKAAKEGTVEDIAVAVSNLSANPKRRQKEAAIIRGTKGIDTDPRFASIPYEDRVALREDADRERTAAQIAADKQAKAERAAAQNEIFLGLLDGNKGKMDIDNARQAGILDSYDSVNKALTILKERDTQQNLAADGLAKITSGMPFDPTDTNDKKMLNSIIKQDGGLERLANGDQGYFSTNIAPLVQRVGDIPTDVAGTLMGMVRGANNTQMMFALDGLAQLRDISPTAFNQRVSSDVAQQVDLWDTIKGQPIEQTELLNRVRGATTQAERQQQSVLRKEAEDILSRSEGGVTQGQKLLDSAVSNFGGWTWSATVGAPLARQALTREFNSYFIEAYAKTGNAASASELATKQLEREWGVTAVGGGKDLMKYPPEKVGYPAVDGSYDWINESVRTDLGLTPETDFDLYADERTREDFQAFQRNADASPPSYRVFIKDENGVYHEQYDDNGSPKRVNFKPSERARELEARNFDFRAREFELNEIIANYESMKAATAGQGSISPFPVPESTLEIPQEDTDAYNAAVEELRQMREASKNASEAGALIGGMAGKKAEELAVKAVENAPELEQEPGMPEWLSTFLFGSSGQTFREAMSISRDQPPSFAEREGSPDQEAARKFWFGAAADGLSLKEALKIRTEQPPSYIERFPLSDEESSFWLGKLAEGVTLREALGIKLRTSR